MPTKLYHHQLGDESPLLDSGSWLPTLPEKTLRRHTLAIPAAHRAFNYNPYFAASQASTLVTTSPIVPPKPLKRTPTTNTDDFEWHDLPALAQSGNAGSRSRTASPSSRLRVTPTFDLTDHPNQGYEQRDEVSVLLRDIIGEMNMMISPNDQRPCLSRATTLCDKEDHEAKLETNASRSISRATTRSASVAGSDKAVTKKDIVAKAILRSNFNKVWYYKNSHLPAYLPTLKIHTAAWPLLTLAARFSKRAYGIDQSQSIEDHIKSSSMRPSKRTAVLRSVLIDDMHVIVFAIRGTHTFLDWTVNWAHTPTSPEGFLDDPSNLCHSGFLNTAELMVKTAAARLKLLLEAKRGTGPVSLLFTGHSAGGASAQLLYAHMLSSSIQSELTELRFAFQDIHCITFGVPPLSLHPLRKPTEPKYRGSLFLTFANEGDPVARADRQVVPSLFKLYMTPLPKAETASQTDVASSGWFWQCLGHRKSSNKKEPSLDNSGIGSKEKTKRSSFRWSIPRANLSLAGSIVILREKSRSSISGQIEACEVSNDMLQTVVFGDPSQHNMDVYIHRIDDLAKEAVTSAYNQSNDF